MIQHKLTLMRTCSLVLGLVIPVNLANSRELCSFSGDSEFVSKLSSSLPANLRASFGCSGKDCSFELKSRQNIVYNITSKKLNVCFREHQDSSVLDKKIECEGFINYINIDILTENEGKKEFIEILFSNDLSKSAELCLETERPQYVDDVNREISVRFWESSRLTFFRYY